jgi:hypothetical protein
MANASDKGVGSTGTKESRMKVSHWPYGVGVTHRLAASPVKNKRGQEATMNMRTPIDTGAIIPALTTIIYEQKAEIAELKSEVAALKGILDNIGQHNHIYHSY